MPATNSSDFHRHIFRELNAEADAKANMGRMHGSICWSRGGSLLPYPYLRVFCDGSLSENIAGGGFVVYGSTDPGVKDDNWTLLAWSCFKVECQSITAAELEALAGAHDFVISLVRCPQQWQRSLAEWAPLKYI